MDATRWRDLKQQTTEPRRKTTKYECDVSPRIQIVNARLYAESDDMSFFARHALHVATFDGLPVRHAVHDVGKQFTEH